MTYRYVIHKAHNVVVNQLAGPISSDDVLSGVRSVIADKNFQRGMNSVVDIAKADLQFGYAEMRVLVSRMTAEPKMDFGKLAVLTPATAQRGLARMFDSLARDAHFYTAFAMFSDISDISNWLQIPPNLLE